MSREIVLEGHLTAGDVKAIGMKGLIQDARRMGVRVGDLRKIFRRLGRPVLSRAKAAAPIGRTRRLKKAIKLHLYRDHMSLRAFVPYDKKYGGLYAAPVHWGRDGSTGPKFMKRAIDDHAAQLYQQIADEINKLMESQGW